MNKTTYLGELEQMILLVVLGQGDDAYGISIRNELDKRVGRKLSRSAAYTTLERLVSKGYLLTRMGDPDARRGGRAKRYYGLSAKGRAALRASGRALFELWAGHEHLLEEA
ncbi:MAG: helix-turn-helix transcriptional regulator [Gemmatimonadota bacterium]|nr:MAG: helix-turn-helix transcriptional regulator [Gemmatimonadota bacterium]